VSHPPAPDRPIVIFGVGSPLAIDLEESCARLGIAVAAGVRNVPGPAYVSERVAVIAAEALDAALLAHPVALPLFTPANRRAALADARSRGFREAATIVDPTAVVAGSTRIGTGGYVGMACTIGGAGTFGDFVIVNRSASVGHHARIEDFASIGPGAVLTGFVHLGQAAVVGAGAVILPRVAVGAHAVIGAGAVVTRPIPTRCLAVGNPARIVKTGLPAFDLPVPA